MRWRLAVPASVANLGPGFDILALAVGLENHVMVESTEGPAVSVDPGSEMPDVLRDPVTNMVTAAYIRTCEQLGVGREEFGASFTCVNRIPMGRGLGSSAAALVSGVLAAHLLHRQGSVDTASVLACAAALEGHPENVAAALLGGLVICAPEAPVSRITVSQDLRVVFFVPEKHSATSESRSAVPKTFSREDAVFNAGRCALLVRALLLDDVDSLAIAMQDRWHQPYRARFFPATGEVIDAALSAGAYGAAQSGAGSSVVALSSAAREALVAQAMEAAAEGAGVGGATMIHSVRNYGATVEQTE